MASAEAVNRDGGPKDPALLAEVDRQVAAIRRACVELTTEEELRKKLIRSLETETPLRVKLGVDPTAHDLHLGFTLPLSKMRIFTDLGHHGVLILGDVTAMVGDPSGKDKTRPTLEKEQVDDYAKSYLEQAAAVLDLDRVEVRRNSEWLFPLGFMGLVKLTSNATVAQMLVRDSFAKRYAEGSPIYLHEFLYPLMQGYDSVVVKADVELGGHDQLFNLHIGRDLQIADGQEPQVCVMGPLLVGLDGKMKMSKSYGNYIGIAEEPKEMFGKAMSLPDEMMRTWFELVTDVPMDRIETLFSGDAHPRELKDALGQAIVRRYHGEEAAVGASEEFKRIFAEKALPDEMPDVTVAAENLEDGTIWIVHLVTLAGFASSNGEARRLVKQGGVKIDDVAVNDEKARVTLAGGEVLKVGKRKFGRIVMA